MKKLILASVCATLLFGSNIKGKIGLKDALQTAVGLGICYGGLRTFTAFVLEWEDKNHKIDFTVLSAILVSLGGYICIGVYQKHKRELLQSRSSEEVGKTKGLKLQNELS